MNNWGKCKERTNRKGYGYTQYKEPRKKKRKRQGEDILRVRYSKKKKPGKDTLGRQTKKTGEKRGYKIQRVSRKEGGGALKTGEKPGVKEWFKVLREPGKGG